MTRRIVDYVVVGASSPAGLREKVMKHLTQDPCWELAGPATNAPVTREGGWYTQTLVRYWQETK